MREPIRDIARLEHILENIQRAQDFVQGKTLSNLEEDVMFRYALVKCLEIIGEASYMLSLEFKDKHPNTPWQTIINMRHVMVHGYYTVRMPIVWDIVQIDLPVLKPQIEQYIKELYIEQ